MDIGIAVCVLSATLSCVISAISIFTHLKNYRRPDLQRLTIRIILLVPIYAISSVSLLFSTNQGVGIAEVLESMREIYEAFVIYTFFLLLVNYLGGERALMATLHDRPMIHPPFPLRCLVRLIDLSDPSTFLWIRRGILQFVCLKPVLSLLTLALKSANIFEDGRFAWDSPYGWITLVYNMSISTAMYCLVLFYLQSAADLAPYRPLPKYICIKAIIFFSFWQGLLISILTALGVLSSDVPIQAGLICLECTPFALSHWYAFSYQDYTSNRLSSRITLKYAIKDCLGTRDIVQDMYHTLKGTLFGGVYREDEEYERQEEDPLGSFVIGSQKRFHRAKNAQTHTETLNRQYGVVGRAVDASIISHAYTAASYNRSSDLSTTSPSNNPNTLASNSQTKLLSSTQASTSQSNQFLHSQSTSQSMQANSLSDITFPDPSEEEDKIYEQSRTFVYGDHRFPVIHEDPRFRNPPHVQRDIEERAKEAKLKFMKKLKMEVPSLSQEVRENDTFHIES